VLQWAQHYEDVLRSGGIAPRTLNFDRGFKYVDWIQLTQDRNQWRALVNTVMNLRLSQKARNISDSWVTVRVSPEELCSMESITSNYQYSYYILLQCTAQFWEMGETELVTSLRVQQLLNSLSWCHFSYLFTITFWMSITYYLCNAFRNSFFCVVRLFDPPTSHYCPVVMATVTVACETINFFFTQVSLGFLRTPLRYTGTLINATRNIIIHWNCNFPHYYYLFLFRSARSIGLRQCLAIRGSCFSSLDPLDIS
jgi:hypothetical protein